MTTLSVLLVLATLFLAYSNGSNDNLKGMATICGSNTLPYKTALTVATITTCAGSVASIFFAGALIRGFSGSGILQPMTIVISLGAKDGRLLRHRAGRELSGFIR